MSESASRPLNPLPFDGLITIRWDGDEGRVVYDVGELDPWSAESMVRQVYRHLQESLPEPRDINQVEDEDD